MNCDKYLILIDDLIEGELDSATAGQVNSHLLNCRECAAYLSTAREEKEIYAQFLFDVEPPKDLWNQFQTKIEAAPILPEAEAPPNSSGWKFNIFNYFRLSPALGFAAVLVVCAFGFWKLTPHKFVSDDKYAAQNEPNTIQPPVQQFSEFSERRETAPAKIADINKNSGLAATTRIADKPGSLNRKAAAKNTNRVPAKQVQPKAVKTFESSPEELQAVNKLSEEQLLLKTLDAETGQQIEKIELLLRSFRNARVVEGGTLYDVAYEKQQARKLLGKNVQLRKIAENYGALYTEELLDKAEPFLLDIANLDNNPLPEKVLDIKERVKNQNIIASLQVY